MPIGIDMNNYDISMGTGQIRMSGGGGLAGNVYINGNVGIRTSNPTAALDVSGTIRSNSSIVATGVISSNSSLISESSTANTGHIRVFATGSANYIQSGLTATSGSAAPLYFTDVFAANRWMTIAANGKVGIGTIAPEQLLEVSSTGVGNNSQINITSTASAASTTNTSTLNLKIKGAGGGMVESKIVTAYSSFEAGQYVIQLKPQDTNVLNVFSSGKVGIGTTSPAATLDVNGTFKIKNTSTIAGIQYGVVAGGTGTGTITFPVAFSSIPVITATIASSSPTQVFSVHISAVSTTQFTYTKTFIYTSGAAGGAAGESFWWIAICAS